MNCLIKATGWIGDALFASSIPEKLKKIGYERTDLLSYRPQPILLLAQNKYIDNVYLEKAPDESIYDKVFELPGYRDKTVQQPILFQEFCGVTDTSSEFYIDTLKQHDELAEIVIRLLPKNRINIAYQGDWNKRRWLYSEEDYQNGKVHTHGDISYIINELNKNNDINLIEISPYYSNQKDARGCCLDPGRYSLMASIIKKCDYLLGCEGGLTNLGGGLRTKCITTMCHVYKHFGPKGLLAPNVGEIMYGPEKLFPGQGHVNLSPFITDKEILDTIIKTVL